MSTSRFDPISTEIDMKREFLGEAIFSDLPANDFVGIMTNDTPKSERLFPRIKEKLMDVYSVEGSNSSLNDTPLANIDDIEILRYAYCWYGPRTCENRVHFSD